jgi:hypothetical protein
MVARGRVERLKDNEVEVLDGPSFGERGRLSALSR